MLYLHGHGATLERDVMVRQAVPRQVAESGQNIALVAPQLAVDAADSSAGNFWRGGHFAKYLDEAAERLMRLYGQRSAGRGFNLAPVVIVAYSGGYLSAAYALERGGANHRIKGVILMDALYGDEDKFATWFAARRRQAFLLSAYTDSTKEENADAAGPARQAAHSLHAQPAQDAVARHGGLRGHRRARHAWRFCYARVAARPAGKSAGADSRLRAGSC